MAREAPSVASRTLASPSPNATSSIGRIWMTYGSNSRPSLSTMHSNAKSAPSLACSASQVDHCRHQCQTAVEVKSISVCTCTLPQLAIAAWTSNAHAPPHQSHLRIALVLNAGLQRIHDPVGAQRQNAQPLHNARNAIRAPTPCADRANDSGCLADPRRVTYLSQV